VAQNKRLSAEVRRELAAKAYRLMLARLTYTEIGKQLSISRQLAASLVKEAQTRIREERGDSETERLLFERERAVDTLDETIRFAWQKLRDKKLNVNSTNVTGLLNAIIAAQTQIAKIYRLDSLPGADPDRSVLDLTEVVRELCE